VRYSDQQGIVVGGGGLARDKNRVRVGRVGAGSKAGLRRRRMAMPMRNSTIFVYSKLFQTDSNCFDQKMAFWNSKILK
jgi:hypothetical protein